MLVGLVSGRMQVEFSEAAAEGEVLLHRQRLVAEEDDQVVHPGGVDLLRLAIAKRPGQVHARDFCPNDRGDLAHFDRFVGHYPSPL